MAVVICGRRNNSSGNSFPIPGCSALMRWRSSQKVESAPPPWYGDIAVMYRQDIVLIDSATARPSYQTLSFLMTLFTIDVATEAANDSVAPRPSHQAIARSVLDIADSA